MNPEVNPQQWLDEHGDALYRFAILRAKDADLAADLVQDTLLAAWKSRDSFSGKSSIRTWLIAILKHKWLDYLRKEIKQREYATLADGDPTAWFDANNGAWAAPPAQWLDDPAYLCQNEQFMRTLQACVQNLPKKQQLAFEMREFQGLTATDICNVCDVSATNLHVLLHRARLALRRCLEHNWFGGER
ncbi:MAG: sigma-70 family RNA polymerase sigma factor [Mariprofundaceae bacterium]|nr:sigma-70 family RNA polymerase sigma factor [Mariprofundaceae bacterium]